MGSRHPAAGLASTRSPLVADQRAEYFEPPSRMQLLDKLHHLIRFSDFLILLEGPSGSGKTTLLRQLRRQTEGGRSARLRLQEVTGTAALLRRVGEASDLEPPSVETEGAWLEQLYTQARLLEETGQQWLLLIDNAGLLDDEALQLLLNFQRAASRQLRLVLADQSVLARLQGLGLDELLEGRWHREELKPFDSDEAEDFIRLCYPALEVFDGRRLQKLVQRSDGLPGSLERLAGDALRLGGARAGGGQTTQRAADCAPFGRRPGAGPAAGYGGLDLVAAVPRNPDQ
ncbi:AAA family ATPase [Marinobacterium aestuariivivens]|uniref:AAA family ATPase n=1 Tax=Marinobacterium aestuariivivens TaxID=1698799 RepID=A0ABW1ZYE0_9GAMM